MRVTRARGCRARFRIRRRASSRWGCGVKHLSRGHACSFLLHGSCVSLLFLRPGPRAPPRLPEGPDRQSIFMCDTRVTGPAVAIKVCTMCILCACRLPATVCFRNNAMTVPTADSARPARSAVQTCKAMRPSLLILDRAGALMRGASTVWCVI